MLFCLFLITHSLQCPGLSGRHISSIIETLVEVGSPIKHFAVSPSDPKDVDISIHDYIGIDKWQLKTLHIVVTASQNNDIPDRLVVSPKDVSALLNPLRLSLEELYCNLDSPSLPFVFDSQTYPVLRKVSLGRMYYEEELHSHFISNHILRYLSMDVRENLCLKLFFREKQMR